MARNLFEDSPGCIAGGICLGVGGLKYRLVSGYYVKDYENVALKKSQYDIFKDWLANYSGLHPYQNGCYVLEKLSGIEANLILESSEPKFDSIKIRWISVNPSNEFLCVKMSAERNCTNGWNGSFRVSAKTLSHKEACYEVISFSGRERAEKIWSARQVTRWTEQNNEQVLVRMPYLTKRRVERAAKKLGINPPALMRDAAEEYLSGLEENDLNVYSKFGE